MVRKLESAVPQGSIIKQSDDGKANKLGYVGVFSGSDAVAV
jgi:hypothetical protein